MADTSTSGAIAGRPPLIGLALLAALVTALVAALVVAGGSGADPAEVDALAKTYTSDDNPLGIPLSEKQARCRAEVYLGSDLSEGALADVRAGRQPRPRTPEDVTELTELASKLADCA